MPSHRAQEEASITAANNPQSRGRSRVSTRLGSRSLRRCGSVALCLLILLAAGCAGAPEPVVVPEIDGREHDPLIVVPGILGSSLRDRETGRSVWGRGIDVVWPRDGGYEIALPLDRSSEEPPRLVSAGVVEQVNLLGVRRDGYRPIELLFREHGYRVGDLGSPRPDDNLFFFDYDFRQDAVHVAAALGRRLEELQRARGGAPLEVDLLCQSNGAHVCRFYAKYGAATLEEAESGQARRPDDLRIRRIVLVGTANGGDLRALRELDRGRHYLPRFGLGRSWQPEIVFTFRSVFQELPERSADRFLDDAGEPLDVDLWSAEEWLRYRWSVYSPEVEERLRRRDRPDLFGDDETRRSYLERQLERARRFRRVLEQDSAGFSAEAYLLIQNSDRPTPSRALLLLEDGEWQTLFAGDRELRAFPEEIRQKLVTAGDGHATVESQRRLSPQEQGVLVGSPVEVEGSHFGVIHDPDGHRALLAFLDRER